MPDLAILVPTRGRPGNLERLVAAIQRNSTTNVKIYGGLDVDDPTLDEYVKSAPLTAAVEQGLLELRCGERATLVQWTNGLAAWALRVDPGIKFLASLGDDHVPCTPAWDMNLMMAIMAMPGPGYAFGNDLLQGDRLPTAWVQSVEVYETLGWVMHPSLRHLYVDNVVSVIGTESGRLAYRPGVVIEHLHPLAGKATWDESYKSSNGQPTKNADYVAYSAWRADTYAKDAAAVAALVWKD
jgi:hypothetical protein